MYETDEAQEADAGKESNQMWVQAINEAQSIVPLYVLRANLPQSGSNRWGREGRFQSDFVTFPSTSNKDHASPSGPVGRKNGMPRGSAGLKPRLIPACSFCSNHVANIS